ncbi:unnamed protein product [Protopolystoma xenopodis]|uniref:Uncharacterized protein n=1 Tax=Protopolystoma xenopodis TaxID=117903 RepID=A0A3S4ZRC5_9PLAT|nr:unnamed protein product [Protopolystoma xenopodis]
MVDFPLPILGMQIEPFSSPPVPDPNVYGLQANAEEDETELGSMESRKHVILHILSQLKLGMDLTKVRVIYYEFFNIKDVIGFNCWCAAVPSSFLLARLSLTL